MTRQDRRDARDLLRKRLRGQVDDASVSQALLGAVDYPHPRSRARVRSRLTLPARPGRWRGRLAVLMAAAALGGTGALAAWVLTRPVPPPVERAEVAAVAAAQVSTEPVTVELTGARVRSEPVPGVVLLSTGDGRVEGSAAGVVVEWHAGEVVLEVDPSRAVPVEVRTREATVRVVGTRFAVERSAAGTAVAVERGAVELTCAGGAPAPLVAPEHRVCGPASAGALLGQVIARYEAGALPAEVLAPAEAGLARAEPGHPLRGQLLYWRAWALVEASDPGAATAVEEALADPTHDRHADLEAMRGRLP